MKESPGKVRIDGLYSGDIVVRKNENSGRLKPILSFGG